MIGKSKQASPFLLMERKKKLAGSGMLYIREEGRMDLICLHYHELPRVSSSLARYAIVHCGTVIHIDSKPSLLVMQTDPTTDMKEIRTTEATSCIAIG